MVLLIIRPALKIHSATNSTTVCQDAVPMLSKLRIINRTYITTVSRSDRLAMMARNARIKYAIVIVRYMSYQLPFRHPKD